MTTQHTPSPWSMGRAATDTAIYDRLGGHIATLPAMLPSDEILANARLIAAAPDLLAALEALLDNALEDCPNPTRHFIDAADAANAAIAKAKGE